MSQLPEYLNINNGNSAIHTFSKDEYENRLAKLRASMSQNDIDCALFTSIHNINYYSDFLYCSFGRPYGLIIMQDKIVSVSANIDGGQPFRRTFGGENLVYTDWKKDNFFRSCQKVIGNVKTIGVEYDHITIERLEKLKSFIPQSKYCDISESTMRMRMIKSNEEIDLIKNGAAVADIGGAACVEAIEDHVPEHIVALHSTGAMVKEIARRYPDSELMDTWTWFQSGLNTDGAHNPVTTRQVQKGDILSLNCFSMISGYYVALERTLFFDHIDDASLRIWEANIEVHEKGIELIKPNVRCCDIAHELNAVFEKHNLLQYRTFGYGHSFGTLSHYYGREAGLELREDIETVLEPNMVISMEPMIMIEEGKPGAGGYREHDILVIKEDGAENITGFPYGPKNNIIKK